MSLENLAKVQTHDFCHRQTQSQYFALHKIFDIMDNLGSLLEKYDIPVPRYTSYPTVPFWDENSFSRPLWEEKVKNAIQKDNRLSLYVHLPYCEKICTYCGCNKRITQNHAVEIPYLNSVLDEWTIYQSIFQIRPKIEEIHLGGGTPTFFSAKNLKRLIEGILNEADVSLDAEFSFEAHPNNTTFEHLEVLQKLGFSRLSLGIQDFDPVVQKAINRPQTFEQTEQIFLWARELGYSSVNADLIYGLPKQSLDSVCHTIEKVKLLRPDRIAFYSYAHVPWKSPTQRGYQDSDLPQASQKRELYEKGRELLLEAGYEELGLDHFALPDEALALAAKNGAMHRNFMGYTTQKTELLIGLGASSISDSITAFAQNHKEIETYQLTVSQGLLPVAKGHALDEEDLHIRNEILSLMCLGQTKVELSRLKKIEARLEPLIADKLIEIEQDKIKVMPIGKPFLRNVALCLDERYHSQAKVEQVFSRAI
jgi:oxygen-independent coproporphyrinogen-3 oxidase